MISQTAAVIGATGLIGNELVKQLSECKNVGRIITITRRPLEPVASHVENHVVDFECLAEHASLFEAHLFFCCLGTTKKQVGSYAAQRVVDVDYPLTAGAMAKQQGVKHALIVSSYGADINSNNEYLKMKGELELGLKALNFEYLSLLKPSLLLGPREQLRLGEKIASWLLPLITLMPGLRKYRPIAGAQVAKRMVAMSQSDKKLPLEVLSLEQIFTQ